MAPISVDIRGTLRHEIGLTVVQRRQRKRFFEEGLVRNPLMPGPMKARF
jgi:hypothetical protein